MRKLITIAVAAVALAFTGAGATAHAATIARAATVAQENATCNAAGELRGHQLQRAYVPSSAWWHTWRVASHADPEMRRDIHAWMRTGRGYWRVWHDCNPDA